MHEVDTGDIDRHIGQRVKEVRLLKGFSQQELGNELGLTFQQIQKYENGKNRISSSKLFCISRVFDIPITFFFEGLDNEDSSESPLILTPQIIKLIKEYEDLSNEGKKGLLSFLKIMKK